MKPPVQLILIALAFLSAFTLAPAKSGVRQTVQALFIPVARPARAIGGWTHDRLAPPTIEDPRSPENPRTPKEVYLDNQRLLTQVANLQAQLEDLKDLSAQYAGLDPDLRKSVRPAAVIGKPDANRATLTIATAGLRVAKEGLPVVHLGGMIGQITGVGSGTATVLLATDPASHLTARLVSAPDENGTSRRLRLKQVLVEGTGRAMVVAGLPARDVRNVVHVGDVALLDDASFTSPLVKGLRLGTVTRVQLPATDAGHAVIELQPTADFPSLREVLVVER